MKSWRPGAVRRQKMIDIERETRRYEGIPTVCGMMMAMLEDMGIRELIDRMCDEAGGNSRLLTTGMAVKAMIGTMFDRGKTPLYRVSSYYPTAPCDILFAVYGFTTDKPNDEARKDLVFKGAFFWNIPESDMDVVKDVWYDTREKIRELRMDEFVKASDDRISHVRPHGRNKEDTYPYMGKEYLKKCFWLNDKYVKDVIKDNL